MRLAITGGSGLIGRALVELALAHGSSVVSLDRVAVADGASRPNLTCVQANVVDYAQLEEAVRGCDALVHLAAYLSPYDRPDYEVHNHNVVASYNALSAAARLGMQRVVLASSVIATGAVFSRWPRFDYFPLDELHPTYNEDPYSLSKWIVEQQAGSFARRYETMAIVSLRFHWVVPDRATGAKTADDPGGGHLKQLWGYTGLQAAAWACWLGLQADFRGHEVAYVVAPDTLFDIPSRELHQRYFPDVPLRSDLPGNSSFFDCRKAERLLGWRHADYV